jgi:hypothetical protein
MNSLRAALKQGIRDGVFFIANASGSNYGLVELTANRRSAGRLFSVNLCII